MQEYEIVSDSKLSQILGSARAAGRSFHHQALAAVGSELSVNARNEDGTIEGIEDASRPFYLGLQWHPEITNEATDSQKIFKAFIGAAVNYGGSKK